MEVIRFINGRPVDAMPTMKAANEGMLQIIREIQLRALRERQSPKSGDPPART